MFRLIRITLLIIKILLSTGCDNVGIKDETKTNGIVLDNKTYELGYDESTDMVLKIIKKVENFDIDGDGLVDEIYLKYSNFEIYLVVNDMVINLLTVDNEKQIFGDDSRDHYTCNIFVRGNKLLTCFTYSFTNKYGSTAWLYCYEYQNGELNKLWDSNQERKIQVKNYDKKNNTIQVSVDGTRKDIIINEDKEKEYLDFAQYLLENGDDIEMDSVIMPQYIMYDYNNDQVEELITRTIVTLGCSSISDNYITIYEFSDKGIKELDSYFASTNREMVNKLFFN